MSEPRLETAVLVVGGGPVGMTLAIALARHGVEVTVAESRPPGPPPDVKSNHVSARSMEIFRRLGVAAAIRDAGLPADYPNDVAYRVTTTGEDLARTRIPARRERFTATDSADAWWPTPEPPHRINQIYLEPVLAAHARATPGVRLLNETTVEGFDQGEDEVRAGFRQADGVTGSISCRYLIGCDGGASPTRKAIGAELQGDAIVQRCQSTFLSAPGLLGRFAARPAWMCLSHNPRRSGTVVAIDGRELWLVHNHLLPEETDFDAVDRDRSIRDILGVDSDFEYRVISKQDWIGRRLVADRLRDRRAFICGDAAHLWVPYAGYGMNAGIADAENLAWLLAARLGGWGGPAILDAYERERRPITEQVSRFAMSHATAARARRVSVPAAIEADDPRGHELRAAWAWDLSRLNEPQYCCGGLNFGYFYEDSPIIAHDGARFPPFTMSEFTPSTVPGCRTPHAWLAGGRSLYDEVGSGFTLLRLDDAIDVEPMFRAARARGVPLALVDLEAALDDDPAPHGLVLSRPDCHVAWRGHGVEDADAVIDLVAGWGTTA